MKWNNTRDMEIRGEIGRDPDNDPELSKELEENKLSFEEIMDELREVQENQEQFPHLTHVLAEIRRHYGTDKKNNGGPR